MASADGLGTIKRTYTVTNGSFLEPHLEELRVRRPDVPVFSGPGIAPAANLAVGLIASSNLSVQMGLLSVTNPLFVEPGIPIGSPVVSALHSVSVAARTVLS